MSHYKQYHIYVGLDLHKAHHTAVIINCWNERLGEIQFENKPSAFDDLMKFVKKHTAKGLTPVYGLEDTGGNGRTLAVHLVEKKQIVKEVNSALSYSERMSHATTQKIDSWDAFCIAKVLLARLDELHGCESARLVLDIRSTGSEAERHRQTCQWLEESNAPTIKLSLSVL